MIEQSLIVYDGECVFCQNYLRFVRLRETIGKVELIDARSGDPRTSVVDAKMIHHRWRSLTVVGTSVFPTCSAANPSLTAAALSLCAASLA